MRTPFSILRFAPDPFGERASVLAAVESDCTGSTPVTRNRYKERYFLDLEFPLPPRGEQEQLVDALTEVAALRGRMRMKAKPSLWRYTVRRPNLSL